MGDRRPAVQTGGPAAEPEDAPAVELRTDTIDSEIGPIVIVTDSRALCALDFGDCEERMKELLSRRFESFVLRHEDDPLGMSGKAGAYLAGDLHALDEITVNPGGTEFQRSVWAALREIPAGTTRTYAQLAAAIGRPTASSAAMPRSRAMPAGSSASAGCSVTRAHCSARHGLSVRSQRYSMVVDDGVVKVLNRSRPASDSALDRAICSRSSSVEEPPRGCRSVSGELRHHPGAGGVGTTASHPPGQSWTYG